RRRWRLSLRPRFRRNEQFKPPVRSTARAYNWFSKQPATRDGGIMTSTPTPVVPQREPELRGQTVVLIGGSAGIGLETARRARVEGADVILTGRNPDRLKHAGLEVGAQRTAAFDAYDSAALASFFKDLPMPIDHVMVTAGVPNYKPLLQMDAADVREALSSHGVLGLEVA